MMSPLLALALIQAPPAAPPVLGTLPRQQLPERGCAAYLWTVQDQRLVAMAEPARLRILVDGAVRDLPAAEGSGAGTLGFAESTRFAGGGWTATLSMTIAQRETLQDGAIVSDATLRIGRDGQDEIAVPVGGLVGCAPAAR